MRISLNSNRLENLNDKKSYNNSNKLNSFDNNSFKNNIFNSNYKKLTVYSTNSNFKKKINNENLALSNFLEGIKNKKMVSRKSSRNIFENQKIINTEQVTERWDQSNSNNKSIYIRNNFRKINSEKKNSESRHYINTDNYLNLETNENQRTKILDALKMKTPTPTKIKTRFKTNKKLTSFLGIDKSNLRENYDLNSNHSKHEMKILTKLEKLNENKEGRFILDYETTHPEKTIESIISTKYESDLKIKINTPVLSLMTFTFPDAIDEAEDKTSNDVEKNCKNGVSLRINVDKVFKSPKKIEPTDMTPKQDKKNLSPNCFTKLSNSEQSKKSSKIRINSKEITQCKPNFVNLAKKERINIEDRKKLSNRFSTTFNFINLKKLLNEEAYRSNPSSPKRSVFNFNTLKLNSGDFSALQETKLNYASPQIKSHTPTRLPIFTNGIALNNFLIRDFSIGETGGNLNQKSKMKFELTKNMFEYLEGKKIKKIKKEREAFEKEKYGEPIMENAAQELTPDYSFELKNLNEDKLKTILTKMDKKQKAKIVERSKHFGELIENLSNRSYEEIETNSNSLISPLINKKNLERVIRVRNIVRKKVDIENDFLGSQNISKFNEQRREIETKLMMTLKHLGPPSFLKTKFKNSTIEKFKIANGKYFGCKF